MKSKRAKISKCLIVLLFFTLSFLLAGPQPVSYAICATCGNWWMGFTPPAVTIPPVIVETDPAIYPPREEAPVSQIVRIVFSQDMDGETTKSAFALYQLSETGAIRQVEGNCSVEGKILTFTPSSFLSVGSIYQINMDQIAWYFVTVADNTPPEITDCSPASGDTGPNTGITFHIRDNNAGVVPGSLILKINDKPVTPSLTSVSKADLQVVYSPLTPFSDGEEITVSITASDFVGNSVEHSYSFTTMRTPDSLWFKAEEGGENIAAMTIDGLDHLWVALRQGPDAGGGVKMFDGSRWHRYSSANGLGCDSATAIAADIHNNVWVGLAADSNLGTGSDTAPKLAQFDGNSYILYGAEALDVPADEEINEIAVDSHDHVWIATTQSGLIEFYNGSILHKWLEDSSLIRAIAIDKNGDIWAGTVPYGVMRLHDSVWEQYDYSIRAKDLNPVDFTVNDLAVDDNGKVWVATNSGLLQLIQDTGSGQYQWTHFIPGEFVNAVTIDRSSGSIWVGTKDGLLKFDGQSNWVNYSTGEPNYPLSQESVTHIAVNPNTKHSEIWVSGSTSLARRDANCPRIVSVSPLAGAADVPRNTQIKIIFSEAMDQSSVTFFSLYYNEYIPSQSGPDPWAVLVPGSAVIEGDVLTFTPSSPLKENQTYTFRATGEMKDLAGNNLDVDGDGLSGEDDDTFFTSFTVENEKIPPQVVSVSPANGARDVPQNIKVKVTFTEAMDRNSAGFSGLYDSQRASVPGFTTIEGNVLTFAPTSVLKEGETYTLKAGRDMKDLAGNRLDGNMNSLAGEETDTVSATFTVIKNVVIPSNGGWLPSYNGLPSGLNTGLFGGLTNPFTQFNPATQWTSPFQLNSGLLSQPLWNPVSTPFGLFFF